MIQYRDVRQNSNIDKNVIFYLFIFSSIQQLQCRYKAIMRQERKKTEK
jgi:hypothetical protein